MRRWVYVGTKYEGKSHHGSVNEESLIDAAVEAAWAHNCQTIVYIESGRETYLSV